MIQVAALFALFFAGHLSAVAAEPHWGDPVNGLRLGIAAEMTSPESDSTLLVLLENTGASKLTVLVGAESGNGVFYHVSFRAKDAQGHVCDVLNLAGPVGVAGSVVPIIISLEPGKQYAMHLPMRKLICVENRTDQPLDALLRRGFSATAEFRTDAASAAWSRIWQLWIGTIRSGDLAGTPGT